MELTKPRRNVLGDLWALGIITAIALMTALLASVPVEVPIIDDWTYAWSVEHFLRTGDLRMLEWSAHYPLDQILWGLCSAGCWDFHSPRYAFPPWCWHGRGEGGAYEFHFEAPRRAQACTTCQPHPYPYLTCKAELTFLKPIMSPCPYVWKVRVMAADGIELAHIFWHFACEEPSSEHTPPVVISADPPGRIKLWFSLACALRRGLWGIHRLRGVSIDYIHRL